MIEISKSLHDVVYYIIYCILLIVYYIIYCILLISYYIIHCILRISCVLYRYTAFYCVLYHILHFAHPLVNLAKHIGDVHQTGCKVEKMLKHEQKVIHKFMLILGCIISYHTLTPRFQKFNRSITPKNTSGNFNAYFTNILQKK